MKRNWVGMKKYKQIEYQVEVDREADLRFNLDAKYLPVIYGVNKIDSIPVFVDTLANDSRKVFVAYAICEGEVAGIYDMYFDDTTSICIDKNDNETRATQTEENTIDVLCAGRMDRGDTLLGGTIVGGTVLYATGTTQAQGSLGNDWDGSLEQLGKLSMLNQAIKALTIIILLFKKIQTVLVLLMVKGSLSQLL